MKTPLIVIGAVVASMLQGCAKKEEGDANPGAAKATSEAPGSAQGSAAAGASATAQIGGQFVAVGEHKVELKLYLDGYAEALVVDVQGKALAKPEDAKLAARAHAKDGTKKDLVLAWQPALARFAAGSLADAKLESKPVELELSLAGGKSARGTLEGPVLLVGPRLGGTLAVAGEHGIEVLAHVDGEVEALVHDRAGARVSGDADAKVDVELTGVDGKLHALALAWHEPSARFTGRLDAGVKLAAGPAKIGLAGKASVTLPKLALSARAAHNGRVVVAGDFSVELVADRNTLLAYAFDASGAAHAKGDLELAVQLGMGAFVKLAWDAPSLSYRANIDGNLDLDAQPIVVSLKADGKTHVGASFNARGRLDANSKLDSKANAKLDAKVKAPELNAKASLAPKAQAKAGAKASLKPPAVKVSPPKVDVSKSAGASTGGKAKASAGFSFGTK